MNLSRIAFAALIASLWTTASGCIVSVGPTHRNAYETCDPTYDTCAGLTTCASANTTLDPTATTAGRFCTNSCSTSTQCPSDPNGFASVCVNTATSGQCYRVCGSGNTCPLGFTCGGPAGMTPFCVPNAGASSACGASGQTCCAGSSCNTGLSCGTNGLCASCGAVGQACCSGSVCTAPGSACGSDGLCGLAPYAGCAASSIGAACLGGTNSSGGVIATTCQRPAIANPGPTGFCSATCAGSAVECPTSGLGGATANCYLLQGATTGQCFVDCVGGSACPANTVCVSVPNATGTPIQICVPPPA